MSECSGDGEPLSLPPWRDRARELARDHVARGDPLGWFERFYEESAENPQLIPWVDLVPNPNLIAWLERRGAGSLVGRALVVGCGLGDDAEELARHGLDVVAFDISRTAIEWCLRRFTRSSVCYEVADLLATPPKWNGAFDLVVECYTLQALPEQLRAPAMTAMSRCVARGGTLLAITRAREPDEPADEFPWPLTRAELDVFLHAGLQEVAFEDYLEAEDPPVRRFRVEYLRVGRR